MTKILLLGYQVLLHPALNSPWTFTSWLPPLDNMHFLKPYQETRNRISLKGRQSLPTCALTSPRLAQLSFSVESNGTPVPFSKWQWQMTWAGDNCCLAESPKQSVGSPLYSWLQSSPRTWESRLCNPLRILLQVSISKVERSRKCWLWSGTKWAQVLVSLTDLLPGIVGQGGLPGSTLQPKAASLSQLSSPRSDCFGSISGWPQFN